MAAKRKTAAKRETTAAQRKAPATRKAKAGAKKKGAKRPARGKTSDKSSSKAGSARKLCEQPVVPVREFTPDVGPERASLIRNSDKKWANGTRLHYHFLKSPSAWAGSASSLKKTRDGFKAWKRVGIGLEFEEVDSPDEAEIRIAFKSGDGHWSYVGRDVLGIAQTDRTMNLDGSDNWDVDTAIHEIGHTLGFPHEHQNPNAGILWDEEAVYADLARPPNRWSREQTFHNIIRKLDPGDVHGSDWDKDSIMHYPFDKGMILRPERYQNEPLRPAPGLSPVDKREVKSFYPPLGTSAHRVLEAFQFERLTLEPKEQANFVIRPETTRSYRFSTFGRSDTVMVLFEEVDGVRRFSMADDDSGTDRNASFTARMYPGRTYYLRLRLYFQHRRGEFGVMMW